MKPFHFHPEALFEADESAKFYEERQHGLGKRFVEALTDAITRIRRTPELFGRVDDNIRKCRILRFPYGVIYRDKKKSVEIIAVMHLKRKPDYWKKRI
ncbi:MAG: type II toxin-antitoxin system RelE/ParE family toxin [Nitrospirota bacterium]